MKKEILEFIELVTNKKCSLQKSLSIHPDIQCIVFFVAYKNGKLFSDTIYYAGELFDEEKVNTQLSQWKTRLNRIKNEK